MTDGGRYKSTRMPTTYYLLPVRSTLGREVLCTPVASSAKLLIVRPHPQPAPWPLFVWPLGCGHACPPPHVRGLQSGPTTLRPLTSYTVSPSQSRGQDRSKDDSRPRASLSHSSLAPPRRAGRAWQPCQTHARGELQVTSWLLQPGIFHTTYRALSNRTMESGIGHE